MWDITDVEKWLNDRNLAQHYTVGVDVINGNWFSSWADPRDGRPRHAIGKSREEATMYAVDSIAMAHGWKFGDK